MALALLALAMLLAVAWPSLADIRTTKHNLTQRYGLEGVLTDEREVCVFCHFPAVLGATAAETPQWQPGSSPEGFTVFDDIGRLGLDGSAPVGSQSVACLACHDANQAFVVTGRQRDHPFGVPYRGTVANRDAFELALEKARASGTPLREAEFIFDTTYKGFRPVFEAIVENRKVYWTSVNENSVRRGKGDLPLYARRDAGVEIPFVECTSCHDPHSTNALFLRVSNLDNKLCLTCHDK
jgi:predicted CXXCH cytochrome family protein